MALAGARRVHRKSAPSAWRSAQEPLAELPDFEAEETQGARKCVCNVTFPHPKQPASAEGVTLVAPETLGRPELLRRVLAACAAPAYASTWYTGSVALDRAAVFQELHKESAEGETHKHNHVAVMALEPFRFLPVKRALLYNFGLASHWSCTHEGYWSVIRYCAVASEKKPRATLDPEPLLWARVGQHPPLLECCHEPLTAAALRKRKQRSDDLAAETGAKPARISEIDVWPVIVGKGFANTPEDRNAHLRLIAFAKQSCSVQMQQFLFRIRARLPGLIDDIWAWERVEETLAVAGSTRLDILKRAANGPCVCDGQWCASVVASFMDNRINVRELCSDVLKALTVGRDESVPIVVLAGSFGGEGKSLFLKGLWAVFGKEWVFPTPVRGNFPLLELPGKKVCFLDDWRFDETVLSWGVQCLWYDGSIMPVNRPQNQQGVQGHVLYSEKAPIFATTKLVNVEALQAAARPQGQIPILVLSTSVDRTALNSRGHVNSTRVRKG